MDGTDVEIEEYEEIVGNWDQASVREGTTDFRAVSIQDPTTDEQFNSMTRTERPALRPVYENLADSTTESHLVVVKAAPELGAGLTNPQYAEIQNKKTSQSSQKSTSWRSCMAAGIQTIRNLFDWSASAIEEVPRE